MPTVLTSIVSAFVWLFGRIAADSLLRWIALKGLLTLLFVVVLPIIFNNIIYDLIGIFMDTATTALGNSGATATLDGTMNFDGFAGWLITCFRVPECISVICGALSLRFCLSMIPFLRV